MTFPPFFDIFITFVPYRIYNMTFSWIDITGMVAAATMAIGYMPQTIRTIRTRSTDDIAMSSFLLMAIGAFFFMVQGLLTKNYYLAAANFLTSSMSAVIVGIKISNDRKKRRAAKGNGK